MLKRIVMLEFKFCKTIFKCQCFLSKLQDFKNEIHAFVAIIYRNKKHLRNLSLTGKASKHFLQNILTPEARVIKKALYFSSMQGKLYEICSISIQLYSCYVSSVWKMTCIREPALKYATR